MTCARSLNLTVCLFVLSGCTLRFSRTSGLNLPPARSLDRSFLNCSMVAAISDSRLVKSLGSSAGASLPVAFCSSRAALPPFLWKHCDVANDRLEPESVEGFEGDEEPNAGQTKTSSLERMFHVVALWKVSWLFMPTDQLHLRVTTLASWKGPSCSPDCCKASFEIHPSAFN